MAERAAAQMPDKDAARGVVTVVACVDADALEARDCAEQGQDASEPWRHGQRQPVPTKGDGSCGVTCVGDERRFKCAAEWLTTDKKDACRLGGRRIDAD